MMPHDWAHAAYEAARREDNNAIAACLTELVDAGGSDAMQWAARRWMERTRYVMVHSGQFAGFTLTPDNTSTDRAMDVDQAPAAAAWSGRLFMAYETDDRLQWDALWRLVGDTPEGLHHAGYAVLRMMTLTAAGYAEEHDCADLELKATRMALAHRN